MTTHNKIVRLLAFAAAVIAAPLAAEQPVTVTGEPRPVYQERVSFADLDLLQHGHQRMLKRRVQRASNRVCFQAGETDFPLTAGDTCPNRTYRVARPEIIAAIRRANSGQPHPATALIVRGPVRTRQGR